MFCMLENSKRIIFEYGELFCGPDGLSLGAKNAFAKDRNRLTYSIRHKWTNDYDQDSCRTYTRNICPDEGGSVICKDVKSLDPASLGSIDAFSYGFPCNDFSVIGKQNGFNGNFGTLYAYGMKIINKFKPKFVVAENVNGLSSVDGGRALKKILDELSLAGDGYKIVAHLYKAEDYGVPQTRHRIIIVGIDKTLGLSFKVPAPTHKNSHISSSEALENPPIATGATNHDKKKQSEIVIKRLSFIKPGQNAWTAELPEELKLNVKSAKLGQIYRRLDPDKPSYTITASGGGGTHGYHYSEPRALTNRERARLQTFPDDFIFEGPNESVRRQIGMAVPPKLANVIFTSILKTFANIEYPSIVPNIPTNYQLNID